MSEFTKIGVGIGILIASAFVGFLLAQPLWDSAARAICSQYGARERLVLLDADGGPHSIPQFSCRFRDAKGSTVIVDENDHLIELNYRHRGWVLSGFGA